MNYVIYLVFVQLLSYSFCAYPISTTVKERILQAFVDYYRHLPNQINTIREASVKHGVQQDENTYLTEVDLIVSAPNTDVTKLLKCDVTVKDSINNGFTAVNHDCQEHALQTADKEDHFRAIRALHSGDEDEVVPILFGGETLRDPADMKYTVLAEESLQKYLKDSGIRPFHGFIQVKRVTTQVVSGSLTRIDFVAYNSQDSNTTSCHSEIWEQPWLNNKNITVSCRNDVLKVNENIYSIGPVEQDPTDPKYIGLAEESLLKYLKDSRKVEPHRVVKIQRVTTAVAAGIAIYINFVASKGQDSNTMTCSSTIWIQSWLNKKDIDVSCHNDNRRVEKVLPGGIFPEDPTDPEYKALADESLRKYLKDSGKVEPHRVVKVNSVTSQVVSGSMTRIDFVASDSQDSNTMKCYSEIWEQTWLNKKDINVSCVNIKVRR